MTPPDSRRFPLRSFDEVPVLARKMICLWSRTMMQIEPPGDDLSDIEIEMLVEAGLLCRDVQVNSRGVKVRLLLTEAGFDWVESLLRTCEPFSPFAARAVALMDGPHRPLVRPHWDRRRRELWCDGILIKRLAKTAPAQQRILEEFEDLGWPRRIKDPLPIVPGVRPAVRLHDAIKRLNRGLLTRRMYFGGDGTATRVCWRYLGADADRLS